MKESQYIKLKKLCKNNHAELVVVSKKRSEEQILEYYNAGHKDFGENRVQELLEKQENLPKDIHWHMIGPLQTNKIKYIVPFIHLIHSLDRMKVAKEIEKQAKKYNRKINVLIQLHIADEEQKHGFDPKDAISTAVQIKEKFEHIQVKGLMGMATFTKDTAQIKSEFDLLKSKFDEIKSESIFDDFEILSMGMSGDYHIALDAGSSMLRVGSLLF